MPVGGTRYCTTVAAGPPWGGRRPGTAFRTGRRPWSLVALQSQCPLDHGVRMPAQVLADTEALRAVAGVSPGVERLLGHAEIGGDASGVPKVLNIELRVHHLRYWRGRGRRLRVTCRTSFG